MGGDDSVSKLDLAVLVGDDVEPHTVAYIGHVGPGKSTLTAALMRLGERGTVLVDAQEEGKLTVERIMRALEEKVERRYLTVDEPMPVPYRADLRDNEPWRRRKKGNPGGRRGCRR